MANSKIYIKPSKRGTLRAALNTPKGQNIPASKLKVKAGDSAAMKKKKIFAQNARKWKKEDGGRLTDRQPLPSDRSTILSDNQNPLLTDMFRGSINPTEDLRIRANRNRYQTANFLGGLPSRSLTNLKKDPETFDRFVDYSRRRGATKRQTDPDYMLRYNEEVDQPFRVPLGFSVPDAINRTSVGAPQVSPDQLFEGGGVLPEYGFGSWLKENSGLISGAGKLASMIPVVGTIAGPIISGIGAVAGGLDAADKAQEGADAEQAILDEKAEGVRKQKFLADRQTRSANIVDSKEINYGPSFMENGGLLGNDLMGQNPQIVEYSNGEKHGESAVGGIPVDARGNPATTSRQSAVGITEKGEITWNGYVFSDKLKTE